MEWSLLSCPILCLVFFFFPFPSCSSFNPLCNLDESSALLQFKNSFKLNSSASGFCHELQFSYPKTSSWENGTDCCKWDGVTCDTLSGRVVGLDLSCSRLCGELHPNSTLFQLTHLQRLNLAHNFFNWSQISSKLGGLVSLTHLNLSYSAFSGKIPSEISWLSKLVSLDLSWNQYALSTFYEDKSLTIESSIWKSFMQNVTNLQDLALGMVDMSSIKAHSLSMLTNFSSSLVSLCLSNNGMQGTLPNSILQFPNLQQLFLSSSDQNLSIQIPKSNWSTPLKFLHLEGFDFSRQSLDSIGYLKSLNFLYLDSCGFEGTIPQSFWNLTQLTLLSLRQNSFSGLISSSLSNLQHLTNLDLSHNNLSGQIPNVFSLVNQLKSLSLSNNNLEGQLPFSFFSLTDVFLLDCSYNKLEGPIPENISGLSNLISLNLGNNFLNGTIPSWCFSLPSLKYLYLLSNELRGGIKELSSYSLEDIDLSNNMLQNSIPESMFDLINLTGLHLSSNNFCSVLDFHKFVKLQNLVDLDLSKNNFLTLNFDNSIHYTIPNLRYLVLSSCNITSIPKFLGHLQNFQSLDLSNNKIHGRIPKWLLDRLSSWRTEFLDLSYNLLEGDLPIPLFGVKFFSVSNNNLTGRISSKICNASSLIVLNLSHNKLTGPVPKCFGTFPNLSVMDLQMNSLSGTVPGNISETNIFQTLNFNHNQLEGPIPRSLTRCKQLEVLDLGDNKIEDAFPHWLESLEELQVLVLRANRFHGVIVGFKSKQAFPKLRIFDVSNNHFNGPLPVTYVQEFKGMMGIDESGIGLHYMTNENYSSYNDSVIITLKGVSRELTRILTSFTLIDFSNNKFEGEIPGAIAELNSLKGLNLSHNRITGTIPPSLGNLKSLEWLDLSSNKLTGEIPKSLTNLNYLSALNLSRNELVGIIPQEKQFGTFSNDSYKGNPGLCGLPLSKKCNDGEGKQQPSSSVFHDEDEFGFGWKAVAVGYGCGFLFGVLMGYLILSIGKPRWLVKLVEGGPEKMMRNTKSRASSNRRRKN